jgi:hypothetical protein
MFNIMKPQVLLNNAYKFQFISHNWRKLHNKFHTFDIKEDEIYRVCSMHREISRVVIGKPEERPLRRPKCRWGNIMLDLRKRMGEGS